MTSSAPHFFASSSFQSLPAVVMTRQPIILAIWMPMLPTPEPAACTSTSSQGWSLAWVIEAVPRRMQRDGQRGSFRKGHIVGDGVGVDGRRYDVFGVAAVQVNADALLAGTPLVMSGGAVFAQVDAAALHPVVHQDPVAHLQVGAGVGADLHHLAGQVAPQDVGKAPLQLPARRLRSR